MDESESLAYGAPRPPHNPNYSVRQTRRNMQLSMLVILIVVFLERLAYYGIAGNLVLFLNMEPLYWMSYNATSALFIFTGISYFSALIGGYLADSFLGKFKTLVIFFVIYFIGYCFMPALAYATDHFRKNEKVLLCTFKNTSGNASSGEAPVSSEGCSNYIFFALGIIGIANGVVRVNISPFGADQVKHEGPTMTRRFFNMFYWCVNLGAFVSLGGLAYVQQQVNFFSGYLAPAVCLLVACLLFVIGRFWYISRPAQGSILTSIFGVYREACAKKRSAATSCCCCCSCKEEEQEGPNEHTNLLSSPITDFNPYNTSSSVESEPSRSCLDAVKVSRGGSYHDYLVNDVKSISKVMIVFLAMIPYWLVYFQMETTFVVQGLHMKLDFWDKNNATTSRAFEVPIAWLSLCDVLCIILLLPLFDRVIYPYMDRRGCSPSVRSRIILGMLFSVAAILCAGGLEHWRLTLVHNQHVHEQTIGNTTYDAADLSILWQVPQYILIGIGELFASVGGLELAYNEAPRSMSGLIMGLFMCTQGIGSMLGMGSMYAFVGIWFSSEKMGSINCESCHLDYYYYVLAGLQIVGILLFVLITRKLQVGYTKLPNRSRISVNNNSNSNRTSENGTDS